MKYIRQIPVGYVEDEPIEIMKKYNVILILQRTQLDGLKEFSIVGEYSNITDFLNEYYEKNYIEYLKDDDITIKDLTEIPMRALVHSTFSWSVYENF